MTTRTSREPRLVALLDGRIVGEVHQLSGGRLRFVYDDAWRTDATAFPLSWSMPLAAQEHRHDVIYAFLWGLLPDNPRTLDQYGRQFGVSPGNPVALLSHIGADCAGAVQFATPENVHVLTARSGAKATVDWMTLDEVAATLRTVRERGVADVSSRAAGQFSLAGAQPKIALLNEGTRWGRPRGRTPTNCILKPPTREYHGFAENEHVCLELAMELGLGAVRSRVMRFGDEIAIVVERFDRRRTGRQYHRIHQEDVCQALGVLPTQKYESDGGPGIVRVVELLAEASSEATIDIDRFLDAAVLHWVLAATDAHAKNYALLHASDGAVRLAPFYDIASFLPYADARLSRVKLAMRVDDEYLAHKIARRHWQKLARRLGGAGAHLVERAAHLIARIPDAIAAVRDSALASGLDSAVVASLSAHIEERARTCW